ncbi:MAG: hypothetical protein LBQ90_10490 [Synergistaceae bacterium]|jgi:primosomal protein N' (replication factor Y)|nr:hypothetical protein [Synergistaceae bacterium]
MEADGRLYVEVVVPGPWWNTLTYRLDSPDAPTGARVRVPLGRAERVGFIAGRAASPPEGPKNSEKGAGRALKTVKEVLDERCILGDELWGLAGWAGRTFLCGMGEALQLICPKPLLKGAAFPFPVSAISRAQDRVFREIPCYNPKDGERIARYLDRIAAGGRTLVLFPEAQSAARFFERLPREFRDEALLWPVSAEGKKLEAAWGMACREEVRVVVGTGRAVFAPMNFDAIIVDDEANPAYVFVRSPRIPARSLAGRRALSLKAELILGGRVPSARTYLRSRPECRTRPQRQNLIFVDMRRSFRSAVRGVEGEVPLTESLIGRTRATLGEGRCALWIMDRRGLAGEVFCVECGETLLCPRCASVMRSELEGKTLRCVQCGAREPLPGRCPNCRGTLLQGKRPGLEALSSMASRHITGYPILSDVSRPKRLPCLFLGTRRALALCDVVDAGLVAWLDLDAEARRTDYNARFQAFSMVWESCWRGLQGETERVVLMQTRHAGIGWWSTLWSGWGNFWKGELEERKSLDLPPYGLLVQIDLPPDEDRGAFVRTLEEAGLSVMDAGDGAPLRVTVRSTERLRAGLAPRFEIRHSRRGFPVVTVCAE